MRVRRARSRRTCRRPAEQAYRLGVNPAPVDEPPPTEPSRRSTTRRNSLTDWNSSTSITITVGARAARLLGQENGRAQAIREQLTVWKAGQIVVNRIMEHALFGRFEFGHVRQRADHPHHLAVGADDRPGFQNVPEVMPVRSAQSQVVIDPARALMQEPVQRQRVAVAVERMQHIEPTSRRPLERAALQAQLAFDRLAAVHFVGQHVPIEDRFARSGHGQRAPLGVGAAVHRAAGPGKGELHHREADQHDDQHQAADEARRRKVIGQIAERRRSRGHHPDREQIPGRDQHHGAVGPARGEAQDEQESDARDGGDGDFRHPRRDRGIIDRECDHGRHQHEPGEREMGVAHMPSAQIEVGEQEDDQRRADRRLDPGAPDSFRGVPEAEHLAPEAEIDADVGEHRPGERRRGGKNHRAADHEDDGQKQRQETGDADQNPLVQGEAGRLVLERLRLPQIKLRQVRRAQLRNVGHGRSGIESQAKNIGFRVVLTLWRCALACGDGRDSRRTEIRPNEPRADKAKMRRNNQPCELLLGIIGQREHDPGRLRPRLERADFNPADDAVGAGRGRHLDAIALGAVTLDRPSEIDRVRIPAKP